MNSNERLANGLDLSTLLRFASSRAYSSRTSCSSGVQVGVVGDGGASAIVPGKEGFRAEDRKQSLLHTFLITDQGSQHSQLTYDMMYGIRHRF